MRRLLSTRRRCTLMLRAPDDAGPMHRRCIACLRRVADAGRCASVGRSGWQRAGWTHGKRGAGDDGGGRVRRAGPHPGPNASWPPQPRRLRSPRTSETIESC
eukprot:4640510-Pyramimonas_sp.AAC.2